MYARLEKAGLENSGVIYRKLSQFPKEKEVYTRCLTILGQIFQGRLGQIQVV